MEAPNPHPNPIFTLSSLIFEKSYSPKSEIDIAEYWPVDDFFWIENNYFSKNWFSEFREELLSACEQTKQVQIENALEFLEKSGKTQRAKGYIVAEICFEVIKIQNRKMYLQRIVDHLASRSLGAGINERTISCLKEFTISQPSAPEFHANEMQTFEIKKLSMLAKAYRNIGNYELANEFYQRALTAAHTFGNDYQIANQTYQLGKMYCNYQKQPERGIDYYKQALEIFCNLKNERMQAACLDDLGDSYRHHLRDYKQADAYFNQALKINQTIQNIAGESRNVAHLGIISMAEGDFKKADSLLKRSIELLNRCPTERRGLGVRFGQQGELKAKLGDYWTGMELLKKALLINREFNDRLTATKNLLKLAEIYTLKKDIKTSIILLNETILLSQNPDSKNTNYRFPEQAKNCFYQLWNLYYESGNFEEARQYFIQGNSLLNHIWDDFLNEQISSKKEMNDTETIRMYQALLKQYNTESHENTKMINQILEKYHQKLIGLTQQNYRNQLEQKYDIRDVASNSEVLLKQLNYGLKAAKTNEPILLLGETGSGKEVFARAIHLNSGRCCLNRTVEKSFGAINCGAIPFELVESELFGHKQGAFTGATHSKTGIFEEYNGGTVFLDEIADLPLSAQVKILRFLQEREIRPVGGCETKKVDVRIIAATNKNPEEEILNKKFREDLYYRLNVIPITIPSLREHSDDIDLLISHILEKKLGIEKENQPEFSQKALEQLKKHGWRGNVRELENLLIRCIKIIDEDGFISENDVMNAFRLSNNHSAPVTNELDLASSNITSFGPIKIVVEKIPDDGIEIHRVLKEIAEYLMLFIANQTNWHSLKQIAELSHLNYEKTKRILRRKTKSVQIKDINIT